MEKKTASLLLKEAVSPYFGGRQTPEIGAKVYLSIRHLLYRAGLTDSHHAEEVFSRTMAAAIGFLEAKGGSSVSHPRAWLHAIGRNEAKRYVDELRPEISFESLLSEAKIQPIADSQTREEHVLQEIQKAMEQLTPRQRELIQLDLGEGLPANEVQRRMEIKSNSYFRKLKSETFKALRALLEQEIHRGIDNVF